MEKLFAVFAANLDDFEWIGSAPKAESALAALVQENEYAPDEFRGVRVYEVNQQQADALIDWCGGNWGVTEKDAFPAESFTSLTFSDAEIKGIFENRVALAEGASRF
jgi:hypothetical protein